MNRAVAYAANAPLMGVPGAAPPPGGQGEWFRGAGGLRLRAALWTPSALVAAKPRGTVVLSTGRTEPIEKYFELIGNLLARGFCVLAHDWRGQGLSARLLPDRLKGHARAVEGFLDDYGRLMETFEARAPKPWIMLGHSMGATLNLMTLEAGETRFSGAVLCSPMLRIKTGKRSMWSVKLAARWNLRHGKAGDYVLDDADDPFDHTFENDALTSDETRYELWRQQLYACPHLAVGGPTWGWLAFALDAGERALKPKALKSVKIPVAIVQAGDLRAVFLEEFDAMAAYVSPIQDLSPVEPAAGPAPGADAGGSASGDQDPPSMPGSAPEPAPEAARDSSEVA